ncbi:MAG: hypothetical protein AVDCRST_MAG67-962, partial [uncultured Solirubrobacteraceae bacterium]
GPTSSDWRMPGRRGVLWRRVRPAARTTRRGRPQPPRRRDLRRPLRLLPHAGGRRHAGLHVRHRRPRARGRPELQRSQGERRGRRLRDPERRLLGRDHAGEHRHRRGDAPGRGVRRQVRRAGRGRRREEARRARTRVRRRL